MIAHLLVHISKGYLQVIVVKRLLRHNSCYS
jgi:hypothetical protein